MKKAFQLISFLVFLIFMAGCYYDNEEKLYPALDSNNSCDTTNVTLSADIMPVLDSRCLSCHGNSTANALGAGINLETYSELMKSVNNGKLEGAVNHLPGYVNMPQGASKLDVCSLNKISAWINQGALNN